MDFITETQNAHDPVQALGNAIIANDSSYLEKDNFNKFLSGINYYVNETTVHNQDAISKEKLRNVITILLFLAYLAFIIFPVLAYVFQWKYVCLILSIIVFFSIPGMIVFEGYNASFYFYYSDLCDSVHSAMYENNFPISGTGIGYYINCFNKTMKSSLYSINYQFDSCKSKVSLDLQTQINTVQKTYLNNFISCQSVYVVIPNIESQFCYKGMKKFNYLLYFYTWLLLFILFLGMGIDRLDPVISKKRGEVEAMIENAEAIY